MAGSRLDRRVQRTHRVLQEALASLIIERGWDDVSVQDICDRADIGRSTFYKHFSGKEKLLASSLENSRQEIRMQQSGNKASKNASLPFARGMLEHAYKYQREFRSIGKRSGYVVQRHVREMIISMVKEDLAAFAPLGWRYDATAHYIAGAFVELLTWWMEARRPQQTADIEMLFDRLTTSAMRQLREMTSCD